MAESYQITLMDIKIPPVDENPSDADVHLHDFRPSRQRERDEPEVLDKAKKTGLKLHAQGSVSSWAERQSVVHFSMTVT